MANLRLFSSDSFQLVESVHAKELRNQGRSECAYSAASHKRQRILLWQHSMLPTAQLAAPTPLQAAFCFKDTYARSRTAIREVSRLRGLETRAARMNHVASAAGMSRTVAKSALRA